MLHKAEPSSTFGNNFCQLATLKFAARHVEHAIVRRATTRSTCNATMLRDKLKKVSPVLPGHNSRSLNNANTGYSQFWLRHLMCLDHSRTRNWFDNWSRGAYFYT